MFGDLWASAKWHRSDRSGANSPLAPRPAIIAVWATAWAVQFVVFLWALFVDPGAPVLATSLAATGLSTALLGGVVHTIARELG